MGTNKNARRKRLTNLSDLNTRGPPAPAPAPTEPGPAVPAKKYQVGPEATKELNNAVSKFGKFLSRDKNRSTRANLLVKVRVEQLSDIPSSLVSGEEWIVHS